jgi:xanthine dehydrogenase YagS FAD-binding subunit
MNKFSYSKVNYKEEAISSISSNDHAMFIAGGTNILDLMKEDVLTPNQLIDINQLDFHSITENEDGSIRLGALATNADTAWHPVVEKRYPVLSKAIMAGASQQLRNMATNGGNLMQRTRCYYFYDTATACNKREPGSGCSAIKGYNRIHAILGASENCIAVFPSDMCVALAILDARVNVSGIHGDRVIAIEDFHRLPGDTPQVDNNLDYGEIITGIDLPVHGFTEHYEYLKIRDRSSYAFALVSVAVVFDLEGDKINEARLALGGVAHKPWRNREAELFLKGKRCSADIFSEAARLILRDSHAYSHNNFKIALAGQGIVRACMQAVKSKVP